MNVLNTPRWWFFLVIFLASVLRCGVAVGAPASGRGAVDQVTYDAEQRELTVLGWAASEEPQVFLTNLRVEVAGRQVYRGRWQGGIRPDVVDVTHRPEWLHSAYQVTVRLPWEIPSGEHGVRVFAHLGNGSEFELSDPASPQRIQVSPVGPWLLPAWLLLAFVGLPALVFARPWLLPGWLLPRWGGGPGAFAGAIGLAFSALVATGTTGSSLPLLLRGSGILHTEAQVWAGTPRPIRSDEWEVITPMALAQRMHLPAYPVVNQNLGTGGQNMMVIGMTGVPVAHAVSIVKPATWGFFVLPQAQALAWYWWFPYFACLVVVWALLWRIHAMNWRMAAAWAAVIAYSPYSAAFSGWPAYLVFFGVSGLLCGIQALCSSRLVSASLWGGGLGMAAVGYVLVLYPAWQISVGYLLATVATAWVWQNRLSLQWGRAQWLALLVCVSIMGLLLGGWWQAAQDAVRQIQATIYPGQRSTSVGGDIDPWYLIKGLLSPSTMYQTPPLMDASDAGAPIWLLIPLALTIVTQWWRSRRLDVMSLALSGYIIFALSYMYIGLPESLARATLWGRVISYRMDLALGLAQVLLLANLWRAPRGEMPSQGIVAAAFSLAVATWCYLELPVNVAHALSPSFVGLSVLAWALAAYLLAEDRRGPLTVLIAGWTLATALPFHPLVQAPQPLALDPELASQLIRGKRIAVIGERRWSLLLPAAGVPVANTVHYYPPSALWQQLDPQSQYATIHNRYQRLFLRLAMQPADGPAFSLETPRLDEVVLSLDPVRFSFDTLQVGYVLAQQADLPQLQHNPGLEVVAHTGAWALLRVHGQHAEGE